MIKKIALVEPTTDIPNIYQFIGFPRLGLPILGTILKREGFEVSIFSEKIQPLAVKELQRFDLIGFSLLTNSSIRGYGYADLLKKEGRIVVMGGPHPTFLPEECLEHCDYVIRGEAEDALLELIKALNGGETLANIRGLSYKRNGEIFHNPDSEFTDRYLNVSPDFGLVKGMARFRNGPVSRFLYTPMVYTSRGCPFNCRYCTVIKLAGRKLRYRDLDVCEEDIRCATSSIGVRKSVMIIDDNFTVDMNRAKELLRRMIRLGKPKYVLYNMQLRVESFKDEEFLSLLNEAGFGLIHVGFESIDKRALKEWKKEIGVEQIRFVMEQAKKFGLKINGMFIVGSDSDTIDTIRDTVDCAIELDMAVMQLFILCPLPGSDVYSQFAAERRIFNFNWKYFDCHHSLFFPKQMKPSTLQSAVRRANARFYSPDRMFLKKAVGNRITCGSAIHMMEKYQKEYEKKLKCLEAKFYDQDENLIVDMLEENHPDEFRKIFS